MRWKVMESREYKIADAIKMIKEKKQEEFKKLAYDMQDLSNDLHGIETGDSR